MNTETIASWLEKQPTIKTMQLAITDLNGRLRGKQVPIDQVVHLAENGMRLPLSSCNVDIWGADIENSPLVYDSGDRDGLCLWTSREPVPAIYPALPSALLLLTMFHDNNDRFYGDPRQVLAGVLERLHHAGLQPVVAFELEFYLLKNQPDSPAVPNNPATDEAMHGNRVFDIDDIDLFDALLCEIRNACSEQNIELAAAVKEYGNGQFELNLEHSNDAMKAADDVLLFKRLVKAIARKHRLCATFMAKPWLDDPGNGMHLHINLVDHSNQNLFDPQYDEADRLLEHSIAGVLRALPECCALFAPHRNSYRRWQVGSHAPDRVGWGYDNRTVAVRVPEATARARRIEHRVAGADANPHLTLAAILAAMHYGIEQKLDPPPPIVGNAYSQNVQTLETDWRQAITRMKHSELVKQLLPEELISLFCATKQQEWLRLNNHMPALEFNSYRDNV